jgi:uncharacterized protein YdeI (YjbR/CyaY-like superfamily)
MVMPSPRFFARPVALRAWFKRNHRSASELWLGLHKRATKVPSVTWSEAVDEALCFGWIDSVRKPLDAQRYPIRFTPRKPSSRWSALNVKKMKALLEAEKVTAAGLAAWQARTGKPGRTSSYGARNAAELTPEELASFQANGRAWAFFEAQAPWYRRTSVFWVVSAKKPETRARRLATLVEDSLQRRPIKPLTRKS